MKKKILLLVILLVPFLVYAKEEISYEWMKENSNGFLFLGEEDNQYLVYDEPNNGPRITYYQPNGKKVSSEYVAPKEDFELIQKINEHNSRGFYINKVDDQVIPLDVYDSEIGIYNEETDEYEYINYLDLSSEDQKKYTGKYHLLYELMAERTPDINYEFDVKDDCIVVYKTVYANTIKNYIEVYDLNENELLSKKISNNSIIVADANEYGIYTLEAYYDDGDIVAELTKYDLNGKEEYTKDLTDLIDEDIDFDYDNYNNLILSSLDVVNNGFIVSVSDSCLILDPVASSDVETTNSYFHTSHNPCNITETVDLHDQFAFTVLNTSGTQAVQGSDNLSIIPDRIGGFRTKPVALIKFRIDYEITTKTEGKGTVKVLSRSEAGNGVTFEVIPKEGYVLSVVKVTDANGNVIEFTDYKFTMPSSDVLIEAVFVPENPYTADIAIVALLLVAIAGGILLLVGRKNLKWLK